MRLLALFLVTLQLFRVSLNRSHAYLDAGSGSMLLQVLLGGVAGAAVVVRMFWHRIGGMLRFGKGDADDASGADE